MIDWSKLKTAEQRAIDSAQAAYDNAVAQRLAAYRAESDPLRLEIEYDAALEGIAPDYTRWREKVTEIKQRIPLPEAPQPEGLPVSEGTT